MAIRLDDYIWIKLCIVRHNPDQRYVIDFITYFGFQKLIREEYGERLQNTNSRHRPNFYVVVFINFI